MLVTTAAHAVVNPKAVIIAAASKRSWPSSCEQLTFAKFCLMMLSINATSSAWKLGLAAAGMGTEVAHTVEAGQARGIAKTARK